jgi:hypothetical protein
MADSCNSSSATGSTLIVVDEGQTADAWWDPLLAA